MRTSRHEFTGSRHGVRGPLRTALLIAGLLMLSGCAMQPATRDAEAPRAEAQQQAVIARATEALRQDRAEEALQLIADMGRPASVAVTTAAAAVRGQALFRVGRGADAVTALVEREHWLDRSADILANQRMIWEGMGLAGTQTQRTGDSVVDGWLALAPLAAAGTPGAEFRQRLTRWRAEYPNHPAVTGLLSEYLLEPARPREAWPRQVALLLPLSSQVRHFALAVRDGFMAAHLRAGERSADTIVRIYDTAELGVAGAYQQALQEGAEFVVGPLLRPDVEAVAAHAGTVPTLALNVAQSELAYIPGFYQFALAPEDEARAIARHAVASGVRNAVALAPLTPGNDRSDRIIAEFRAELERLGGRLLVFDRYEPTATDFASQVASLLNINRSTQRRTRLQNNLGTTLAFEPRLRQDVEFIFIVAAPRAGRMLTPQLRALDAAHLPTYAISDVHVPGSGTSESDLNGLIFADLPWLLAPDQTSAGLRRDIEAYWPNRSEGDVTRLYAMGFDAYQLIAPLHDWTGDFPPIAGMSGTLTVDDRGRIRRELPLAQFRNGRPVAIESPPGARPTVGFASP